MSDKVEFDKEPIRDAIREVRNEKNDAVDWCLIGYESAKSNKILLVGKGNGGVASFVDNFQGDNVLYALVRKSDQIDNSITTKFAFIHWIGDQIKGIQKAKIAVHRGQVTEFIGQYHVDFVISSKDEISDTIVETKIKETSGSASKVLDSQGQRTTTTGLSSSIKKGATTGSGGQLQIQNEADVKQTIRDVRSGTLGWCLLTYDASGSSLVLLSQGTGDASEMVQNLNDSMVAYGLIRKTEQIDQTSASKFAFIKFQGSSIPVMLKARLGTHSGVVTSLLSPYHVTIDATSVDEITDNIIMNAITAASGTKVNVLGDANTTTTTTSTSLNKGANMNIRTAPVKANPGAVPKAQETSAVKYTDEAAVRDAIKEVRKDNIDPRTDWVLVGYEGGKGNTLTLLGKGNGGLSDVLPQLNDKIVAYCLLRKTEKIDQTEAVKFVFIEWIGENIDRMHKARLSTYSGSVNALFQPWHVDLRQVSRLEELSDDIINTRIQENSGTKSKVKN